MKHTLFLFIIFFSAIHSFSVKPPEVHFEKAMYCIQKTRYRKAINHYDKAMKQKGMLCGNAAINLAEQGYTGKANVYRLMGKFKRSNRFMNEIKNLTSCDRFNAMILDNYKSMYGAAQTKELFLNAINAIDNASLSYSLGKVIVHLNLENEPQSLTLSQNVLSPPKELTQIQNELRLLLNTSTILR